MHPAAHTSALSLSLCYPQTHTHTRTHIHTLQQKRKGRVGRHSQEGVYILAAAPSLPFSLSPSSLSLSSFSADRPTLRRRRVGLYRCGCTEKDASGLPDLLKGHQLAGVPLGGHPRDHGPLVGDRVELLHCVQGTGAEPSRDVNLALEHAGCGVGAADVHRWGGLPAVRAGVVHFHHVQAGHPVAAPNDIDLPVQHGCRWTHPLVLHGADDGPAILRRGVFLAHRQHVLLLRVPGLRAADDVDVRPQHHRGDLAGLHGHPRGAGAAPLPGQGVELLNGAVLHLPVVAPEDIQAPQKPRHGGRTPDGLHWGQGAPLPSKRIVPLHRGQPLLVVPATQDVELAVQRHGATVVALLPHRRHRGPGLQHRVEPGQLAQRGQHHRAVLRGADPADDVQPNPRGLGQGPQHGVPADGS
eukprot:RCo015916